MPTQRVSKKEIIALMSEDCRSFARALDKKMGIKSVEIRVKKWERKK
jgi:hypothetical protein